MPSTGAARISTPTPTPNPSPAPHTNPNPCPSPAPSPAPNPNPGPNPNPDQVWIVYARGGCRRDGRGAGRRTKLLTY